MEFIQRLLFYLSLTALVGVCVGLIKPWVALWWEDTQNRKKVLKLYGSTAVITFVLYLVLKTL